jgi:hypothetical protein
VLVAALSLAFLLVVAQPLRRSPNSSTDKTGNLKNGKRFMFKIFKFIAVGRANRRHYMANSSYKCKFFLTQGMASPNTTRQRLLMLAFAHYFLFKKDNYRLIQKLLGKTQYVM